MDDKSDRLIGVDIGKRFLDVAREGVRAIRRHSHDAVEIARLVDELEPEHDIVIFERSGGYERRLEGQLAAARIRCAAAAIAVALTDEHAAARSSAIDA